MTDDLDEYRTLEFMPSRIPAQDALELFLPAGTGVDPEVQAVVDRAPSRWYPADDGYTLRMLYQGGGYDATRFKVVPGGWDHEHCSRCRDGIEPMTLCWITKRDPWVLLDEKCYREVFPEAAVAE